MEIDMQKLFTEINDNTESRTLFIYGGGMPTYGISIFDLKTLSPLCFDSRERAVEFCDVFKEDKCKEELLNYSKDNTYTTPPYIYICTDKKIGRHQMVNINQGQVYWVNTERLIEYTREGKVHNLELSEHKDKITIKWSIETAPDGFKESVKEQYEEFKQTMKLLGKDIDFSYEIIGKYVILTELKNHENVTVPSFITSLSEFISEENLTSLTLLDGVKFIGSNMVMDDKNIKINIKGGRTLEYIGDGSVGNTHVTITKK